MAILSDTNVKLFDWDVALAKFPSACHEDCVERWVGVVAREGIKARPPADMPELFFQELDRRVKSDVTRKWLRCPLLRCALILMRCA